MAIQLAQTAPEIIPAPQQPRPPRRTRRADLFAPDLVRAALKQSFVMLRPDIQWKNPVMFVVEIGTVLTLVFTVAALLGQGGAGAGELSDRPRFLAVPDGAVRQLRHGAGRSARQGAGRFAAQTRRETPAYRLRLEQHRRGSLCRRRCEPAIASSSRPVRSFPATARSSKASRRSTNRRSPASRRRSFARPAATAPASPAARAVLSDRIVVQITASAGKSFLDRMIALVEGAIRQRTPNEIALSLVLSAFTLIFLIVTVAAVADGAERRAVHEGLPRHRRSR